MSAPVVGGFAAYRRGRLWKDLAHLALDVPVGLLAFSAITTALSIGAGLLFSLLGVPLLLATVHGGRYVALAERARARALLDLHLDAHPPLDLQGDWKAKLRTLATDRAGWTGLAHGLLLAPWSIVSASLLTVTAVTGVATVTAPAWVWLLTGPDLGGRVLLGILLGALGAGLVWVFPALVGLFAEVDRTMVGRLCAPDPKVALAHRLRQLRESRDASVASAAAELARIERDLHDGAQQRLVSLAMHTGLAKERLRDGGDERAAELVGLAHEEAKAAIAELRDLVRGIHPVVLTDRGLDAAVSALVARCPVPVTVHSDLDRRVTPAVEAAAYFVIAEALTNLAKHSGATSGEVRITDHGDRLRVEVADDGRGGAVEGPAGGLRGLRDRVVGAEGTVRVVSPAGGPTTIVVELPCGP